MVMEVTIQNAAHVACSLARKGTGHNLAGTINLENLAVSLYVAQLATSVDGAQILARSILTCLAQGAPILDEQVILILYDYFVQYFQVALSTLEELYIAGLQILAKPPKK